MAYKADWRKRSKRKGAAPGGQEITSPDVRSFGFRALSATQDSRGAGWLAGWLAAPSQAKEKRHGKAERKRQHWRKRIGYETERERLISSLTGNKKEEENWKRRRVRHEVVENPDLALQPRISSKFTFI